MIASGTSLVSVYASSMLMSEQNITSEIRALTLCKNSRSRPSLMKRYVLKKPLVHDLGARNVSCAVPTTRCSSLFFVVNGTMAIENAASLLSR